MPWERRDGAGGGAGAAGGAQGGLSAWSGADRGPRRRGAGPGRAEVSGPRTGAGGGRQVRQVRAAAAASRRGPGRSGLRSRRGPGGRCADPHRAFVAAAGGWPRPAGVRRLSAPPAWPAAGAPDGPGGLPGPRAHPPGGRRRR